MKRLEGRIAVISGGASGLGLAFARLFAAEGAHVVLADIDIAAAEQAAAVLRGAGRSASAMAVDVTRGQDVTALMRHVAADHGRIDVLVNNAGINVRSDFRQLSDADWVKIREVNLDGVLRLARDGFELLKASGRGSLINVASILGDRGLRQAAAYTTTKGAVVALTRALAVEYAPFDVRVNALSPGFVETPLTVRALRIPEVAKSLLDQTPMRRFGAPEEIAKAALFLACDDSSYMTGAELVVDGGMTAAL